MASETEAPDDFARRGWIAFRLGTAEVLSVVYPGREDRPLVSRWSR